MCWFPTKSSYQNAFFGALVAIILFWLLRKGFTSAITMTATYKTLYGALATLPIFLIWMYLAWAVVIFGAVFTAALEEYQQLDERQLKKFSSPASPKKIRIFLKIPLAKRTKVVHYDFHRDNCHRQIVIFTNKADNSNIINLFNHTERKTTWKR